MIIVSDATLLATLFLSNFNTRHQLDRIQYQVFALWRESLLFRLFACLLILLLIALLLLVLTLQLLLLLIVFDAIIQRHLLLPHLLIPITFFLLDGVLIRVQDDYGFTCPDLGLVRLLSHPSTGRLALEELRGDQGLQKRGQDALGCIAVLLVASAEGVLYGQYFMGTYHHLVEADRIKGWERS